MFNLDRQASTPLVNQICDGVVGLIELQQWQPGSRLPSVRQLAERLGVSSFTVASAYDRLTGLGVVQARRGSGYFVAPPQTVPAQPVELAPLPASHPGVAFLRRSLNTQHYRLPVSCGFLPPAWLEDAVSPSVTGRLMRTALLQGAPAPIAGSDGLRERLAFRLREKGLGADAGRILLTNGVTHGFFLLCQALLAPDDYVVVEDPSYFLLQLKQSNSPLAGRVLRVPRRADGPDLQVLAQLCQQYRPKLLLTQTLAHNPIGGHTSMAVAHRLLMLAEQYGFYVAEDDIFGDLASSERFYLAQLAQPQQHNPATGGMNERVFYLSSFSKVLSPALRIGLILTPARWMQPLLEHKVASVMACSLMDETLVQYVLEAGRFQRHVERLQERVMEARSKSMTGLQRLGFRFEQDQREGLFIWARVPAGVSVPGLIEQAQRDSIFLASGEVFSQQPGSEEYLRLNASYCQRPEFFRWLAQQLKAR
ncbi:aminotransferase-like domain-containing protein [Balneatrix alpica]|uniref:PLP-dependent aminotransferase family protein n=1 Tax=Balneatrix alpica TaxID=75684 RepID=A0ABV5ZCF4_9GAMM|nr:PLP-dependent aminotransferase family protein [Balneatrix alpica]